MRVLLSTIGSRGDVQPMVALALQLRELGQEVRICAPPDFSEWIGTIGITFVAVGPEVRQTAAPSPSAAQTPPTPEQLRQLMEDTVTGQFETITVAARGCDVLVAAPDSTSAETLSLFSQPANNHCSDPYASQCHGKRLRCGCCSFDVHGPWADVGHQTGTAR